MNNEQKLKECLIPTMELRNVMCVLANGVSNSKVQQMYVNCTGDAFVWKDLKLKHVTAGEFHRTSYDFE